MPMPYSMETGPNLSLFESFFNDDRNRAAFALKMLRNPEYRFSQLLRDIPSAQINGAPAGQATSGELADYIDEHWFGLSSDRTSGRSAAQTNASRTGARQGVVDEWQWDYT